MTKQEQIQSLLVQLSKSVLNSSDLSSTQLQEIHDDLLDIAENYFPAATGDKPGVPALEISGQEIIQIWTDGACTGNPGPGGWGALIRVKDKDHELTGSSRRTTNNIMEMTGALEALKTTPKGASIVLTSDSQYLIKGITQWVKNWKKKNWIKSDGNKVLNREIWEDLDLVSSGRKIKWVWVKGHAGHPENERCDQLARDAISQIR